MKNFSVKTTCVVLCAGLSMLSTVSLAYETISKKANNQSVSKTLGNGQVKEKQDEEMHEEGITFSPEQMSLANIEVTALMPRLFSKSIYATGEIKANGYNSYVH